MDDLQQSPLATEAVELAGADAGPVRTVLHVGSGPARDSGLHPAFRRGNWREVRLDIDARVRPHVVNSIVNMHAVPTASVDAVWSSHNLEHLFDHEVPKALAEFHRVLSPTGFALITVPSLSAAARAIAEGNVDGTLYVSPSGPIAAIDIVFGFRPAVAAGNHFMSHRTGFTAGSLATRLKEAGFAEVEVTERLFALWALAHKTRHPDNVRLDLKSGQADPA